MESTKDPTGHQLQLILSSQPRDAKVRHMGDNNRVNSVGAESFEDLPSFEERLGKMTRDDS